MVSFVVHDSVVEKGSIFLYDGDTLRAYPIEPFAYTSDPTPVRLEGGRGWLRYLTTTPSRWDRVYPPSSAFIVEHGVRILLNPLTLVFDLETTELFGEIELEGSSVSVLGSGSWVYGMGGGIVSETLLDAPDLMVGYNLFNYDLKVLFKQYPDLVGQLDGYTKKVNFRYGGDTKEVDAFYSRVEAIDLYLSVLRWDVENGGKLHSHSLKEVAPFFGFKRTTGDWVEHRGDMQVYLYEDVASTAFLASKLLPPLLSQLIYIPVRPTDIALLGTGQKVDILMAMSYRVRGYGIPKVQKREGKYEGALVEANPGVYKGRIYKYDFASLYPSIIVNEWMVPEGDILGLFPKWVKHLREVRLKAKAKKDDYHQSLQAALKILVNSAYGYCAANFPFGDVRMAASITAKGRELVSILRDTLQEAGIILNVDTDGVLVQLREGIDPDFVDVVVETRLYPYQVEREGYDAALVIKKKNYILRKGDKIITHGNSLRNRTDEPFLHQFIQTMLTTLFETPEVEEELVLRLMRSAMLNLTPEVAYQRKRVGKFTRTHRSELVAGLEDGEKVDLVKAPTGWVRLEDATDLDKEYYLQRLLNAVGRFGGWFEEFEKRYRGKTGLQNLSDTLSLGLAITAKRKKEQKG